MLSETEARQLILERSPRGPEIRVPLTESLGRRTTRALVATCDLPGFDNSSMDGYAVRAAEAVRDGTNAVVLAHHGCSALGDSTSMALRRAMNLEEAATMTYRLILAGDTDTDFPAEFLGRIISI